MVLVVVMDSAESTARGIASGVNGFYRWCLGALWTEFEINSNRTPCWLVEDGDIVQEMGLG